jgi:hypothetical protein
MKNTERTSGKRKKGIMKIKKAEEDRRQAVHWLQILSY